MFLKICAIITSLVFVIFFNVGKQETSLFFGIGTIILLLIIIIDILEKKK
jgi:hypothetical protein